jgi:hypothetical protein
MKTLGELLQEGTLDSETLRQRIEAQCIRRVGAMQLRGKKKLDEECAFIAGAMAAIQAINPNNGQDVISSSVPHNWIVAAMRGCSPFENKKG